MAFFKLAKGRAPRRRDFRDSNAWHRGIPPVHPSLSMRLAILICGAKLTDDGVASELESAFRRLRRLQSRSDPGRNSDLCKAYDSGRCGPECDAGNRRYLCLLSSSGMEGNGAQER
jgi:hypothetical protein